MKRTGFRSPRKPMKKVSDKRAAERFPLRENAEGQPCTLRLPGCRGDPGYTVLCHIRRNGWGGAGCKPNDLLAFFACDTCHDKQERHHDDCTEKDILRALGETLMMQEQSGIIRVAK